MTPNELSIEKCKTLLSKSGTTYTNEDIILMRNYLIELAETFYNRYQQELKREHQFLIEQKQAA
jgi:hypothetical protein